MPASKASTTRESKVEEQNLVRLVEEVIDKGANTAPLVPSIN